MYGSGCWAQNENGDFPGVACSTTGKFTKIWHPLLRALFNKVFYPLA